QAPGACLRTPVSFEKNVRSPKHKEYHANVAVHREERGIDTRQVVARTSRCSHNSSPATAATPANATEPSAKDLTSINKDMSIPACRLREIHSARPMPKRWGKL